MKKTSFNKETLVTTELAKRAALAAERIRIKGIESVDKEDGSPLTQADIVSQAIILSGLKKNFPEDRIVAEETLAPGKETRLGSLAGGLLEELGVARGHERLLEWVNYRGNPDGTRTWMVDPIDGTKGFRKGLCYAIAIGLYFRGRPRFGCMAVPLFPDSDGIGHSSVIAYAGKGTGACLLDHSGRLQSLYVSKTDQIPLARLLGSRAHDSSDICGRFGRRTGTGKVQRMDGQAKYLMLASGRSDLYIRAADPVYGIGFTWDHCAGQVILEEAGGMVTDLTGDPLDYESKLEGPLSGLKGMVASNALCHREALEIIGELA